LSPPESLPASGIIVVGPTACGKSQLGIALARAVNGEIVSCDSVLVYRGFDIGSAKPSPMERAGVPHHLIDVADWSDDYDTGTWAQDAKRIVGDICARGQVPIIVGGTGLYLRAFLGEGFHTDLQRDDAFRASMADVSNADLHQRLIALDPERAAEIHANDRYRTLRALELLHVFGRPLRERPAATSNPTSPGADIAWFRIMLEPARDVLHARIAARTSAMLAQGFVEEVRGLLAAGCPVSAKPMQAIGYRQIAEFLTGEAPAEELENRIRAATRQYAKRQCTWFRNADFALRLTDAPDPQAISQAFVEFVRTLPSRKS